jgi:hypothetical protein
MSKTDFANGAYGFVNRVARLPGFPIIVILSLAAAGILTVAGAFGTSQLPLATRAVFWLCLMGWNALKWQLWFAWRVRRNQDWWPAALIGTLAVNWSLPFEIALLLAMLGVTATISTPSVWLEALAIAAIIAVVIGLALRRSPHAAAAEDSRMKQAEPNESNDLLPFDPSAIHAVTAEDHYCRFHLADGSEQLVLSRFGDLLGALATLDGEQTHRSAWVASAADAVAIRRGRSWRLQLASGQELPVSRSHAARVRHRGWLRRSPRTRR